MTARIIAWKVFIPPSGYFANQGKNYDSQDADQVAYYREDNQSGKFAGRYQELVQWHSFC